MAAWPLQLGNSDSVEAAVRDIVKQIDTILEILMRSSALKTKSFLTRQRT